MDADGEEALIHQGEALTLHDCGLGHTLPCAFCASEGRPAALRGRRRSGKIDGRAPRCNLMRWSGG